MCLFQSTSLSLEKAIEAVAGVKNSFKEYSDLDLCYHSDIPDVVIAKLMDDFEQSDLPFKVDIIAWKRCSPEFQQLIKGDLVPIETILWRDNSDDHSRGCYIALLGIQL